MTCPKWIEEALAAAYRGSDVDPAALARELIERLPVGEMIRLARARINGVAGLTGDWVGAIAGNAISGAVRALGDSSADAVTLTELYNDAARALDLAGAPYANNDEVPKHLDLAARVRWLAMQRPTRLDLQRVEAERDEARARVATLERQLAQAEAASLAEMT